MPSRDSGPGPGLSYTVFKASDSVGIVKYDYIILKTCQGYR